MKLIERDYMNIKRRVYRDRSRDGRLGAIATEKNSSEHSYMILQ